MIILGLPQLIAKLHALPLISNEAAEHGRMDGAQKMAADAQARAAVLTGALKASVGTDGETVYAQEEYARFLEYGTSKMPAQPFLGPAFEAGQTQVVMDVAAAVKLALARF